LGGPGVLAHNVDEQQIITPSPNIALVCTNGLPHKPQALKQTYLIAHNHSKNPEAFEHLSE